MLSVQGNTACKCFVVYFIVNWDNTVIKISCWIYYKHDSMKVTVRTYQLSCYVVQQYVKACIVTLDFSKSKKTALQHSIATLLAYKVYTNVNVC